MSLFKNKGGKKEVVIQIDTTNTQVQPTPPTDTTKDWIDTSN
jgi:hypothetical protein